MATVRDDSIAASIWQNMKVQCPICKKTFSSWYCPNCGLPKNNSSYGIYEDKIYYCGSNHFRREFGIVNEFQLCSKCLTPNPYNANYCRNCGEDITLHAKDKNGHGWIDLGLSVLWSANSIGGYFQWNNTRYFGEDKRGDAYLIVEYEKAEKKDVATYMWGEKWRTPTKEEFEELIEKCKWEKCLIANQYALKATGPNGNSIIFPTDKGECGFWTSSKSHKFKWIAYKFFFRDWFVRLCDIVHECTLGLSYKSTEEKNKSWNHVQLCLNEAFELINQMKKNKDLKTSLLSEIPFVSNLKEIEYIVTRTTKWNNLLEKQIKEWERDLSHFRWKEGERLWLETPIKISCDENSFFRNITGWGTTKLLAIRPVADKKWQGKL